MISVSYLKSINSKKDTINLIDKSIADLIHVDLMDGEYVFENNLDINEIINDLKDVSKPLDIHLMVNSPIKYIDILAKLKPYIITFHLDSLDNPNEVINLIKDYNIKVGIAINPSDNINILNNYYDLIDYVLIMSVNPGKGGQLFQSEVLSKLKLLENKNLLLGIDGGINNNTIKYLHNYKIDIIVSGSYICNSNNYNEQINTLKKNML